jgi:hypothetical protein
MRIASKSVMGLVISNGLERYKVNLPAVAFPDLIRGPVHSGSALLSGQGL